MLVGVYPRSFWWFSGPPRTYCGWLAVNCPRLGGLGWGGVRFFATPTNCVSFYAMKQRIFRIPGTEDSTGVGLGLAIARELVVSHGGRIGLQSTSGKGSEFYFDLPATSNGVKA